MPGFELFGSEEHKEIQDVLETGVLCRYGFDLARRGCWKARTFESELAKRVGVEYCHLCSSGTTALVVALVSTGVRAGDEVIVPPFTFVATIEAVLSVGAIPVFAEIDETLCLDPESVEAAITPRTKAVLPVHMCGAMARIDKIKALCERKDLILIEDACQAFGGSFGGRALGTFGQLGCFSFDYVKIITCGEGGAVVTGDKHLYTTAQAYADHGHDHVGPDRALEGHAVLGTNFRIGELNAAVGLAQLKKLNLIIKKQRAHKKILEEAVGQYSNIVFQEVPDPLGDSATFLSFFLPDESSARRATENFNEAGVGSYYWFDNNWHYIRQWNHLKQLNAANTFPFGVDKEYPDYEKMDMPKSDDILKRTTSIQIKLSWSKDDLLRQTEKITRILKAVL